MTERQATLLKRHINKATVAKREAFRVQIILNGAAGMSNEASARQLNTDVEPVKKWRARWQAAYPALLTFEQGLDGQPPTDTQLSNRLLMVVKDAPGRGRQKVITAAQEQQLVALSCSLPSEYGLPQSKWTKELLRQKAIELGIVSSISAQYIGVILKKKR